MQEKKNKIFEALSRWHKGSAARCRSKELEASSMQPFLFCWLYVDFNLESEEL